MKNLIVLFSLLSFSIVNSQELLEPKRASFYINEIINHSKNDGSINLYISDIETIDSLIRKSTKKYIIVYNFSHTCHSSTELVFPELVNYVNENSEYFDLFPIIGYRYDKIPEIEKYLKKIGYFSPVLVLDTEKYGNKSNPFARLHLLIGELCKECDYKRMGFSSFFVIDNKKSIILHNTWNIVGLEKFEQLKKLKL